MSRDWNALYLARDMRWDKGEPAPPLVDDLARRAIAGRVLVPGCGQGHDVRCLAAAGAEVLGLDLAPAAIDMASNFPAAGSERYRVGDFLNLPGDLRGTFDWVVEHTLFCALDPALRPDYVAAAHAALKPGGRLWALHYMEVEDESPDDPPWGATEAELDELFSPRFVVEESFRPARNYPSRTGRELVRVLRAV